MNSSASSRARCSSSSTCEDLRAHRDVEHRDRLVADDPGGLEHERGRDRDALALAARELVRVAVAGSAPARARPPRARAPRARRARPCATPVTTSGSATIVAHAPARVQRLVRVLEDHLDRAAQRAQARPAADLAAVGRDAARRRRHEPEHRARERRLAAARLPDDAEDLAAPPLERDAVERARRRAPKWTARSRTSMSGVIRAPPRRRRARASAPTARSGRPPTAPARPRAAAASSSQRSAA